jgi:hypothetical protein
MKLALNSELPRGVHTDLGGGPEFYMWCRAAEARARARRGSITRAWTLYEQGAHGDDPYPGALVLCQRLGVALEDLARLLAALESERPWEALRAARLDDLDAIYNRLAEDRQAARTAFRLPSAATLEEADFDAQQRDAVLAAAAAIGGRWHRHLVECAAGWALLRRLAKAMRHGSPLLPRPLVLDPPGAGALGAGLNDRFDRCPRAPTPRHAQSTPNMRWPTSETAHCASCARPALTASPSRASSLACTSRGSTPSRSGRCHAMR